MCGVFGVIGHAEAARISYLGLYALQHRGQESSGIAAVDSGAMFVERGMGQVADLFDEWTDPEAVFRIMRAQPWPLRHLGHRWLSRTRP